jgi:histidinol-phosphate phosphatase family protein
MTGGNERAAVFLDRDGTLIEDGGYLSDPNQVRLLPGVLDALRELHSNGYALVLVSNQSGIGRGVIPSAQAEAVHERLVHELAAGEVLLDAALYCPHIPEDRCVCRKPEPAMLRQAATDLGIRLDRSVMVGDKACDVEAGHRAGCRTVLLGNGDGGSIQPDFRADSWGQVVRFILGVGGK